MAQAMPSDADWRKSSYSGNNGACVEVAFFPGAVAARDSKDPDGAVLRFAPRRWAAFLHHIAGERAPRQQ